MRDDPVDDGIPTTPQKGATAFPIGRREKVGSVRALEPQKGQGW